MVLVEVAELGELAVEVEADGADRTVTLLGDDHLGGVVHLAQALLPALQEVA